MRSYLTYAQDQNMIDLYLESERIASDNWYTMYRSEQEALSLKGVALHYDCECFERSAETIKYRKMNVDRTAAN